MSDFAIYYIFLLGNLFCAALNVWIYAAHFNPINAGIAVVNFGVFFMLLIQHHAKN